MMITPTITRVVPRVMHIPRFTLTDVVEEYLRPRVQQFMNRTMFNMGWLRSRYSDNYIMLLCLNECAIHECPNCTPNNPRCLKPLFYNNNTKHKLAISNVPRVCIWTIGCLCCKPTSSIVTTVFLPEFTYWSHSIATQYAIGNTTVSISSPISSCIAQNHVDERKINNWKRVIHDMTPSSTPYWDGTLCGITEDLFPEFPSSVLSIIDGESIDRFSTPYSYDHRCKSTSEFEIELFRAERLDNMDSMLLVGRLLLNGMSPCLHGKRGYCIRRHSSCGLIWIFESYRRRLVQVELLQPPLVVEQTATLALEQPVALIPAITPTIPVADDVGIIVNAKYAISPRYSIESDEYMNACLRIHQLANTKNTSVSTNVSTSMSRDTDEYDSDNYMSKW